MRRRKHEISSVDGALDLTSIPVTMKDLKNEWNARKNSGVKKVFVSFLKEDIEYIYAFRFLKEDIEKDRPVVQLAFIRTREEVYSNRDILTDQEREYLRAVVRLFGHRLGYIRKIKEYTLEELGL